MCRHILICPHTMYNNKNMHIFTKTKINIKKKLYADDALPQKPSLAFEFQFNNEISVFMAL